MAGTYYHTITSSLNCDSVIKLTFTVNPADTTQQAQAICQGNTFTFYGTQLTTAGIYYHTLTSSHSCDSVIKLMLTVNPADITQQTQAICQGNTFNFYGTPLTTAGTYYHTLTSSLNCDSVIKLTFTVNPADTTQQTQTICQGNTFVFYGTPLTTAGTYYHTITSSLNCDSVIKLTFTVNPADTTQQSQAICQGNSFNFYGTPLTTAGTYYHTITSSLSCDSVIKLTFTVNPVDTTQQAQAICQGNTFNFYGTPLTTAGTYYHTLTSSLSCDSVVNLTLTVNPIDTTQQMNSICEGNSYNFYGTPLTTAGTYYHTLASSLSCDSVIKLTLTVNPVDTTQQAQAICQGNSFNFYGTPLTTAGTYYHTLTSSLNCDSVINLTLNILPVPSANAGNDTTINIGSSAQLNGSGGIGFSWNPVSGLSCSDCANPVASPLSTTSYILIVTDANGCTDADTVIVIVDEDCGEVFVPTAFSPNKDGQNEMECVYGNCIKTIYFAIYDHWGEKVFETTNPKECWDGDYKGKPLNTGVFVYYMKTTLINGTEVSKQGNISLVR